MRKQFEMNEVQLAVLLDACKPVPYMVFGGIEPRSPQQNANDAWAKLGREMGFDAMTVEPDGDDMKRFTADEVPA